MSRRRLFELVGKCPEDGCDGSVQWHTETHRSTGIEPKAVDVFVGLCTVSGSHQFIVAADDMRHLDS
jgi:hypothetical protein